MTYGVRRPHVLALSYSYPSSAMPTRGLWTQRLTRAATAVADVTVIAPVPYVPPGVDLAELGHYRRTEHRAHDDAGFDVYYPHVVSGLTRRLHSFEATLDYHLVRRVADRINAEHPIDLIHAHFIYPAGVIAARLGRRYGAPVVTTEPAWWRAWFAQYPRVGRQVERWLWAIHTVTGVSDAVRRDVEGVIAGRTHTDVLPNVVDEATFVVPEAGESRDPNAVLFVGLIRQVKGLDLLVRAMAALVPTHPALHLVVVGESLFRGYRVHERDVRRLVHALGLDDHIEFVGSKSPAAVAAQMRHSAVVVVPSRRETFCVVLVEALASGTPVVATRCGAPEELLDDSSGRLVPVEDPTALAEAIEDVIEHADRYDPRRMHDQAVERFGYAAVARKLGSLYGDALGTGPLPPRPLAADRWGRSTVIS